MSENLLIITMNSRDSLLREIEIDEGIFGMRKDGILQAYLKDGTELDVALQMKMLDIYDDLTKKVKTPFIFEANPSVTVTKEARDNAISLEKQSPMGSCAVVVKTTAHLLIANFYYKFNKPTIPYKVFKDFDKAVEWSKTTDCYQPQRILKRTE